MSDLTRLTEALERLKRKPPYGKDLMLAIEAARLVVDGQDVQWCETHVAPAAFSDRSCWRYVYWVAVGGDLTGLCHMVSARLIFPKQGES